MAHRRGFGDVVGLLQYRGEMEDYIFEDRQVICDRFVNRGNVEDGLQGDAWNVDDDLPGDCRDDYSQGPHGSGFDKTERDCRDCPSVVVSTETHEHRPHR
jgi:hypothetical protein